MLMHPFVLGIQASARLLAWRTTSPNNRVPPKLPPTTMNPTGYTEPSNVRSARRSTRMQNLPSIPPPKSPALFIAHQTPRASQSKCLGQNLRWMHGGWLMSLTMTARMQHKVAGIVNTALDGTFKKDSALNTAAHC